MKDTMRFRSLFEPKGCANCRLRGHTCVVADSNPVTFVDRVDVLFLGVNPGRREAYEGRPFVGPAGELLRSLVEQILPKRIVAYSNIILCSTPNEAGIPDTNEVFQHCRENVISICKFFLPRIYVPCGNAAMRAIGIVDGTISRNAGRVFTVKTATVIPILHPSAILRGYLSRAEFAKSMETIAKILAK